MHDVLSSPHPEGVTWRALVVSSWLVAILSIVAPAAFAQASSPEIIAKERKDPAAGEVVIINRKKRKGDAPDPYAPIKLKPLPEKWSEKSKEPQQPAKEAVKKPTKERRTNAQAAGTVKPEPKAPEPVEAARSEPTLATPPLPTLNTQQRTASARLRQFPLAGLSTAPRQIEQQRQPRRRIGPTARDRAEWRRYRDRRRYSSNRRRPWRQCRQLARRCNAGFEGSCIIWERRC